MQHPWNNLSEQERQEPFNIDFDLALYAAICRSIQSILADIHRSNEKTIFIPNNITIPSDYSQNTPVTWTILGCPTRQVCMQERRATCQTAQTCCRGGQRQSATRRSRSRLRITCSHLHGRQPLYVWWHSSVITDSLSSQINPTSISYYQGESSSFDAQPIQNNLFPLPWSNFYALDCDDVPTYVDPSLTMDLMTSFEVHLQTISATRKITTRMSQTH